MPNYKNIVGSGFPEYVNSQIKKRGEKLNTTNRSNNILEFLTNRNVWFRLSSGVDVDSDSSLAKNNVLQGADNPDNLNFGNLVIAPDQGVFSSGSTLPVKIQGTAGEGSNPQPNIRWTANW